MKAGPRASASGERHSIARGIEAEGRDAALRLGSREPGAAIAARAQNLKLHRSRVFGERTTGHKHLLYQRPPELYLALTGAYQLFSRDPNETTLRQLQWQLGVMETSTDERVRVFFEQMAMGAREFHSFYDLARFKGSDELQLTSMVAIVSHWRSLCDEDLAIVHDASSNFLRGADLWRRITSSDVPHQLHRSGDGSFTKFPLRVTSTTPMDSKISRSIQFCDVLAGLSARHFNPLTQGDERASWMT